MSTLKQQLLTAAIDALAWSVLTGMMGGSALADDNHLSAVLMIALSFINARNAVIRWQLFRAQTS